MSELSKESIDYFIADLLAAKKETELDLSYHLQKVSAVQERLRLLNQRIENAKQTYQPSREQKAQESDTTKAPQNYRTLIPKQYLTKFVRTAY